MTFGTVRIRERAVPIAAKRTGWTEGVGYKPAVPPSARGSEPQR